MENLMDRASRFRVSPENGCRDNGLTELKIFVPDELARAWPRCSWQLANETGRERTDLMKEMVKDFLIKYGC